MRALRTVGAAAMALLLTAALAPANMLVNPGFEDNGGSFDGWDTFGNGPNISTPADDDVYRTGQAAAKIYGEFANCDPPAQRDYSGVGGFFQAFTPTAGKEYAFSGYSYVSSGDAMPGTDTCNSNRVLAKIIFFNGAAEIASNEVVVGDGNFALDVWHYFEVVAPAPSSATNVQAMFLFLQPACDTGSVFIDDCSFVESTPTTEPNILVNPSFDTDLSGWTTFGNVYYDGRSWARRTPTGGAKLYGTFTPDSDSGLFQIFPASEGGIWRLDVHSMTTCVESPMSVSAENMVLARIVFKDSTGTEIGFGESVIGDPSMPLGTWTKHSILAEAPAQTDSVAAYVLFVQPALEGGAVWIDDLSLQETTYAGVEPGLNPPLAVLHQNVPNPFNPTTRIQFEIAERGNVEVSVYNIAGRRVARLHRGTLDAGPHSVEWDGTTSSGELAASGTYWYVVRTPAGEAARSMVLLK